MIKGKMMSQTREFKQLPISERSLIDDYCGKQVRSYAATVSMFAGGAMCSGIMGLPEGMVGCGVMAVAALKKSELEYEKCVNEEMKMRALKK
jgi:hypothetical protein